VAAAVVLSLVATAWLAAGRPLPHPTRLVPLLGGGGPAAAPGQGTVVRVVDGDTLVVTLGGREEPVRLIGIDTPESVAPDRPVECYGAEASARLGAVAPAGTAVRLERDVEPRDRYDRLLAYVYRAEDDLFLNEAQVAGGYAEASEYPPNTTRRSQLERAERTARTQGLGLWAACGGPDVVVAPAPSATPSATPSPARPG
jgi:micrococcal nuclease